MKVKGPMFSLEASGTIGGVITAATWKGRPYFRTTATPSNPRSAGQISTRAMFKFLAQQWANLDPADQATWEELAASGNYSPFNAYQKYNQKRWTQFTTPSMAYPAAESDLAATWPAPTLTAGVRQVTITANPTALNQNWGMLVYRGDSDAFTPTAANLRGIVLALTDVDTTFVDTPVAAGTYWYAVAGMSIEGKKGGPSFDAEITVT